MDPAKLRGGASAEVLIDGGLKTRSLSARATVAAVVGELEAHRVSCRELEPQLEPAALEARLREARALLLLTPALSSAALPASRFFELATRARQAGVPAFAMVGANDSGAFTARILDLQRVFTVRDAESARAAAAQIALLL